MGQREPKHFINALARGLRVLSSFTADRPRLTLQEIAQITGYNKTAVQRLTDTLIALGYIGRNRRKEFYLEPRILTLGFHFLGGSELRQLAATYLKPFSERIGQTVNLAVLDDLDVIFVFRNEIRGFFSFGLREGSTLPSYCTASGKALLAGLPDEELRARLQRIHFRQFTRFTIPDAASLLEDIARIRREGFAVADQEGTLALYSVAVPVFGDTGKVAAAANISLPAEVHAPEEVAEMVASLQEEGARLSQSLGYRGDYPGPPFRAAAQQKPPARGSARVI